MGKIIDVKNTNRLKGYTKIIAITDMKLTVKARSDKSPTPEKFEGLKKIVMTVVSMGHSYADLINRRMIKSGLNCVHPTPFVADETYSEVCSDSTNGVMRQHKEETSRKYIRGFLTPDVPPNFEIHYVNGQGAEVFPTQQEKDDFFPKDTDSAKQAAIWLEGSAQVKVRDWKAENVLYIQNGKTIWNNLDEKTMKLFDLTYVEDGE